MNEAIKFIDELIKSHKESKDTFMAYSKTYPNDEVFSKCVKKREQQIQTLKQIKCELEAFEQFKKYYPNIDIILEAWEVIKDLCSKNYFSNRIELPMECHEKIKKALEVKDANM